MYALGYQRDAWYQRLMMGLINVKSLEKREETILFAFFAFICGGFFFDGWSRAETRGGNQLFP